MWDFFQPVLIALVPSLIIAWLTARLTVKYSLRQFTSQRLWEKRVEIYTSIIENLNNMFYLNEKELYHLSGDRQLSRIELRIMGEDYLKSFEKIRKIAIMAELFTADRTNKIILKMLSNREENLNDTHLYRGRMEENKIIKKCKESIIKIAKEDLMKAK